MNAKGNILSSFVWKFGERISAQLVSTIVSIVLARILMPEDYGIVAIVTVIISLCNAFVVGGFGNALIQKTDASATDFSSMFYVSMLASVLLYFALFWVAKPIAEYYQQDILCPIIRVMGLRIPIAGMNSIQHAYIARNMQFKKFFFSTLIGTVISAFVGIWMAVEGYGPWALVGQYLTNVTIDTIVLFFTSGWRPQRMFDAVAVKNMMPFSLKLMGATLLDSFFNEIRSVIIFTKYSSADLSMYENGKKYPNLIITNVNTAIGSVLFPAMSNMQSDISQLRALMKRSTRFSTFLLAPMLCGLFAVAPRFVSALLTDKWLPSVPYIQITCCMCLFYPIHTVNIQAMNAIGESGKTLKLEIVKKVINILVLLISMNFGVLGIALGSLAISLLSTWINAFYSKRFFDYSFSRQIGDIMSFLLMAVCMAAVVVICDSYFQFNNWLALGVDILIGAMVYLLCCKIFRIRELTDLWGFAARIIKK